MKRAALYLRVSTIDQTTANQERELRQVAERAGWEVDKVYKDHGISGSKGRDKRTPDFIDRRLRCFARVFPHKSTDRCFRPIQGTAPAIAWASCPRYADARLHQR